MGTPKLKKSTVRRKRISKKASSAIPTNSREFTCRYQLLEQTCEADYKCGFDIENFDIDVSRCIFHLPKYSSAEKKDFNVDDQIIIDNIEKKFNEQIQEIILNSRSKEFIDFRGFIFPESVSFNIPFPVKADFNHAVFVEDVDFAIDFKNPKPEHEYDTTRRTLLKKGSSFKNCLFKGKADFSGCEIEAETSFEDAVFEKDVLFSGLSSNGRAIFNNTVFKGDAFFDNSYFNDVSFDASNFEQKTDFLRFSAGIYASFSRAVFDQEVEFYRSKFATLCSNYDEAGNKLETEEHGSTYFDGAIFNEKVVFCDVNFENEVSFDNATFKKQTNFVVYKTDMFSDVSSFRGITLPKDEDFTFDKVNLNKARFHDTNLEKIIFRDVLWATEKNRLQRFFRGRSYILWDEIRPLDGMNDHHDESKTAENYRQLVLNYESKRDYESAEYFHIGEMEMRRRKVDDRIDYQNYKSPSKLTYFLFSKSGLYRLSNFWSRTRKYLNGYGAYWLSSRYGTSYTQAITVLILLILIFSFLFLFSGIKTSKEVNTDNPQIIEYNFLPDSNHISASPLKFLSDYKETLSYSLSIITFQKERFYEPLDWEARYLLYLAVFILTAQSALVLLAIRRQFKR